MTDGRGHPSSENGLSEAAALPDDQPSESSQESTQVTEKAVAAVSGDTVPAVGVRGLLP